ncbi:hypothetical protein BC629DRAFT_800900 [Irpex lacteus]|nr:hypothetical protein BC629DRAFT_800900 [Irpex lacteus]
MLLSFERRTQRGSSQRGRVIVKAVGLQVGTNPMIQDLHGLMLETNLSVTQSYNCLSAHLPRSSTISSFSCLQGRSAATPPEALTILAITLSQRRRQFNFLQYMYTPHRRSDDSLNPEDYYASSLQISSRTPRMICKAPLPWIGNAYVARMCPESTNICTQTVGVRFGEHGKTMQIGEVDVSNMSRRRTYSCPSPCICSSRAAIQYQWHICPI